MDIQTLVTNIYHEVKPLAAKGEVAKYIPALASISPNNMAISLHYIDGKHFSIGDYNTPFSIQSIVKVLSFTLAHKALGNDIWKRIGKEPSGNAFNSLVQLEHENGIPRNPFINAGAIVLSDIILSHYKNPEQELLNFAKKTANETSISYNEEVARSEKETGYRNSALAYFMKSCKNIINPVEDVLDLYFLTCSLEMSTYCLAKSFLYLSNHGIVPSTNEQILTISQAKRTNALMLTSGLYNESGEFAYRVGIPAKSGVGGGIVAIIPKQLSICVWSPPLNEFGNSYAGICALEKFTTETGVSVF
ncbi:MAG: glutaminase [Bacteroidales bacterium]|nr:glutaminase [Candidatus Cloacimonadota bacterium]MDD2550875.1 glutaminase [Bacteroidales bacterium]MDD4673700.1 glutaminase [Bacteroidales bacterium]MDY0349341.1 glutaminase [Tenuifilaceae bacterium]